MLQSNAVQPQTKYYTLMWSNPKPNVEIQCVSTKDQMIQSNVVPPISSLTWSRNILMSSQTKLFPINYQCRKDAYYTIMKKWNINHSKFNIFQNRCTYFWLFRGIHIDLPGTTRTVRVAIGRQRSRDDPDTVYRALIKKPFLNINSTLW